MTKLEQAIVAVGITFGPLFMTQIFGTAPAGTGYEMTAGGIGLIVALALIVREMHQQRKQIEELRRLLKSPTGAAAQGQDPEN